MDETAVATSRWVLFWFFACTLEMVPNFCFSVSIPLTSQCQASVSDLEVKITTVHHQSGLSCIALQVWWKVMRGYWGFLANLNHGKSCCFDYSCSFSHLNHENRKTQGSASALHFYRGRAVALVYICISTFNSFSTLGKECTVWKHFG